SCYLRHFTHNIKVLTVIKFSRHHQGLVQVSKRRHSEGLWEAPSIYLDVSNDPSKVDSNCVHTTPSLRERAHQSSHERSPLLCYHPLAERNREFVYIGGLSSIEYFT